MAYDDDGNIIYIANTPIEDLGGCEGFQKEELIEMEDIIHQQRERALEDIYDKYAKAGTAEEADSVYSRGVCLDAIMTDRFGK